jgi:uncharacterized protein involved in propanediol utilization
VCDCSVCAVCVGECLEQSQGEKRRGGGAGSKLIAVPITLFSAVVFGKSI